MVWLGNNNRSPINVPFFVHCPSLFFVCSSRCRQLPPILLSFLPSCLVIVNTSCSRSRALRVPATPYALITLLLTATAAAYLVLLGSAWSTSSTRRYCFCFPCRFVSRAVALALAVLRCAGAPRTPHFPVSRHQHVPVCCFFLAKEHFTVLPCPVSRSSSFFFLLPDILSRRYPCCTNNKPPILLLLRLSFSVLLRLPFGQSTDHLGAVELSPSFVSLLLLCSAGAFRRRQDDMMGGGAVPVGEATSTEQSKAQGRALETNSKSTTCQMQTNKMKYIPVHTGAGACRSSYKHFRVQHR